MDKASTVFNKLAHSGNLDMALSQMDKVKDYANLVQSELLQRHAEGHILIPAWVASKVTKAEDYLNSVYDYMSADNYTHKHAGANDKANHLFFKVANMAQVNALMAKGMTRAQAMRMAYPKGGALPAPGRIGTHAAAPPLPVPM
tara:strand:- start:119 stop:550 length:432 start_codon:yes stop_codon:yes gene_type:complete